VNIHLFYFVWITQIYRHILIIGKVNSLDQVSVFRSRVDYFCCQIHDKIISKRKWKQVNN